MVADFFEVLGNILKKTSEKKYNSTGKNLPDSGQIAKFKLTTN
jgi:hypothetical protein